MALMELVELVVDEALLDPQVKEGDEGMGVHGRSLYITLTVPLSYI